MSNDLDNFSKNNLLNGNFQIIEKSKDITSLDFKLEGELYNKALDIARDIVKIIEIEELTQREINIIREKAEFIKCVTDNYIRQIQAEGDVFIKKIEALKKVLIEIERALRDSNHPPEIKEFILKIFYEKIKND